MRAIARASLERVGRRRRRDDDDDDDATTTTRV